VRLKTRSKKTPARRQQLARAPQEKKPRPQQRELHGEEQLVFLRGKRRGDECESLVRHVLSRPDRPWWLRKVRAARPIEDRSGVDVVVYTDDVGRLFLQVKRSPIDVAEWYRQHDGDPRPIAVIVAHELEDPEVVYGKALALLIVLREQIQAARAAGTLPPR